VLLERNSTTRPCHGSRRATLRLLWRQRRERQPRVS
jgi:hypothetical protein